MSAGTQGQSLHPVLLTSISIPTSPLPLLPHQISGLQEMKASVTCPEGKGLRGKEIPYKAAEDKEMLLLGYRGPFGVCFHGHPNMALETWFRNLPLWL